MYQEISIDQKIAAFSLKVKACKYQVEELVHFLNANKLLRAGKFINATDLFISREIAKIAKKLQKKLQSVTEIKSIRLDFYEISAIDYYYKVCSQKDTHLKLPQMVWLISEIKRNFPSII